jgi:hypothetical protein
MIRKKRRKSKKKWLDFLTNPCVFLQFFKNIFAQPNY